MALGSFDSPLIGMASGYFANRGPGSSPMQALGGGLQGMLQMQMLKKRQDRENEKFEADLKESERKAKTAQRLEKLGQWGYDTALKKGHSEEDAVAAREAMLSGKTTMGVDIASRGLTATQMTGEIANLNIMRAQQGKPPMSEQEYLSMRSQMAAAGAVNVNVGTGPKMPVGYTWDEKMGEANVVPGLESKAYSQGERVAAGYSTRMVEATKRMNTAIQSGAEPGSALQHFFAAIPVAAPYLTDPQFQILRQSQEDWVRAKLRKESGAAIPVEEMDTEIETYFPKPGEPLESIENKRRAREVAEMAMQREAGSAYSPMTTSPATVPNAVTGSGNRRRYDPDTGKWQ